MATNLILSKESSESEIKAYFNAILKLSESDNEFPVNLDEVWMIVYSRKSDAVEVLQKNFIQNVDYQVLRQNPQNLFGGRPTTIYRISVPCLEFFIARKIRLVFEVYRKVFHKTVKENKQVTTRTRYTKQYVENLEMQLNMFRAIERQERELKCSCFSYLVAKGLYGEWEEFKRRENRKKVLCELLKNL